MTVVAGVFLVVHGLLHLAVWVAPPQPDAPFDPRHSWLFGDVTAPARLIAVATAAVFVVAGVLVITGAGAGPTLAAAGAVLSLALVAATFNPWFVLALAINVAIVVVALT